MRRFGVTESRTELRTNADRHPDIGRDQRARAAESIRRDADDGVGLPVDVKSAADEIAAAAVAFPKAVACHHHSHIRIWFTFLGVVKPAAKRVYAHHWEIILRSQKSEAAAHVVIAPNARDGELERGNIGKHVPVVFAQLAVLVVRERAIIVGRILSGREHIHDFVRPNRYHRLQHHSVDQRENGRVNADC